jgi:hypothetical protein
MTDLLTDTAMWGIRAISLDSNWPKLLQYQVLCNLLRPTRLLGISSVVNAGMIGVASECSSVSREWVADGERIATQSDLLRCKQNCIAFRRMDISLLELLKYLHSGHCC